MQDQALELVPFMTLGNFSPSSCVVTVLLQQLVRFLQYRFIVFVGVRQSLHLGHQRETEAANAGDQNVEVLLYDFLFYRTGLTLVDGGSVWCIGTESCTLLQSDTIRRGAVLPLGIDE